MEYLQEFEKLLKIIATGISEKTITTIRNTWLGFVKVLADDTVRLKASANNKFMIQVLLLQREKTINTARSAINGLFINYINLTGVLELLDSINRLLENDKNPLLLSDIEKKEYTSNCTATNSSHWTAHWTAYSGTHWSAECKPNIMDDNYGVLSD